MIRTVYAVDRDFGSQEKADLFLAISIKPSPAADRLQVIDQAIRQNHLSASGQRLLSALPAACCFDAINM